jgi:hypothetical protein
MREEYQITDCDGHVYITCSWDEVVEICRLDHTIVYVGAYLDKERNACVMRFCSCGRYPE